jgi:hypothetical protein
LPIHLPHLTLWYKLLPFLEAQNFNSIISQLTTSGVGGLIHSAGIKRRKKGEKKVVDPNAPPPPPPPPVVEIVPPSQREVVHYISFFRHLSGSLGLRFFF